MLSSFEMKSSGSLSDLILINRSYKLLFFIPVQILSTSCKLALFWNRALAVYVIAMSIFSGRSNLYLGSSFQSLDPKSWQALILERWSYYFMHMLEAFAICDASYMPLYPPVPPQPASAIAEGGL